jgi:hypothetical protein
MSASSAWHHPLTHPTSGGTHSTATFARTRIRVLGTRSRSGSTPPDRALVSGVLATGSDSAVHACARCQPGGSREHLASLRSRARVRRRRRGQRAQHIPSALRTRGTGANDVEYGRSDIPSLPTTSMSMIRPVVFMNINIGETHAGRSKRDLFSDVVPKCVVLDVIDVAWVLIQTQDGGKLSSPLHGRIPCKLATSRIQECDVPSVRVLKCRPVEVSDVVAECTFLLCTDMLPTERCSASRILWPRVCHV